MGRFQMSSITYPKGENNNNNKNNNNNNNNDNDNNNNEHNNDNNDKVKFKKSMIRSSLCDYSNAYILVKETITILNTARM